MARSTTWSAVPSEYACLSGRPVKSSRFSCFTCGVRIARAYNFVIRRSNRAPHFSSFSWLYKYTVFCYPSRLLFGLALEHSMLKNVKSMANSPSILENCHPSWLALQPKKTSQSSFGKWLADCYRGWMAVQHGVAPGYEAQAPCILDSESKRYRPRLAP
jgi:hypothetical protein